MTPESLAPDGDANALPKGLIVGTFVFAVLGAAAVAALLHFGQAEADESSGRLEKEAINVSQEALDRRK